VVLTPWKREMKRRDFIKAIAGSTAAWPLATHAQQPAKLPTIGILASGTPETQGRWWAALVEQLRVLGWIEGRNVAIKHRWAEGRSERFTEIAAEFVRLNVEIIITDGSLAIAAAKRATPVIPIVFAAAGDPVAAGLVASLASPGGNVTGMSLMSSDLGAKRLELLREVLPQLSRVAVLWNVDNPYSMLVFKLTQDAGLTMGIEVRSLEVRGPDDFDIAFEVARGLHPDALITVEDPLTLVHRTPIAEFTAREQLPSLHAIREFVAAGGLMSYGASLLDLFRRAAFYVDKILRGAKPSDLPVQQPTKFEMVINLKTAKALGLTVPPPLLARADEVIE
jgi:putative tryptophan/tyrosine transport system substrate-binding protein